MDRPPLRPLDLSDLLDESIGLYRRNFTLFAGIVAVLAVPQAVLNAVVTASEPTRTVQLANGATESVPVTSASNALILLISFVFTFAIYGALGLAVSRRYLSQPTSIVDAYRDVGWKPLFTLALGSILALFAIGIGFAALLIPGIFLLVRFLFYPQAVIIERAGLFAGFGRSWELTRGSFWRVLGYGVVVLLIMWVFEFLLGGVIAGLLAFGGSAGTRVLSQILTSGISIVILPFVFTALTLLYYDLRVRKEGYDVQMMVNTLRGNRTGP